MTDQIYCSGCNGGPLDAQDHGDGLCCFPMVECVCGNLVEGDGTPRCEVCREPLCDDCRTEDSNGHDVHREDCLDEYAELVLQRDEWADGEIRRRRQNATA